MPRPLPGGTCLGGWRSANDAARVVLARGGDADPVERNRHISAAYAQYYQRHPTHEWAGIAAIVSRQAGCSMRHARTVLRDSTRQIENLNQTVPSLGEPAAGTAYLGPAVQGTAAGVADRALANTNREIFSDIFPVLRFHEEFGAAALARCGSERVDLAGRPGDVPADVRRALGLADTNTGDARRDAEAHADAGNLLAAYEQGQIVESRIMTDFATRAVFKVNQWMGGNAVGRALGARPPEVALTAGCEDGTPAVPFRGDFTDPARRIAYYQGQLAPAFRALPAARVGDTISRIAQLRP